MSKKHVRDIASSVHRKLINLAHAQGKDPNQIRLHYVMERFLYRLSRSSYADHFILKGGLLLCFLGTPSARPTMDIDLLGKSIENTTERISTIFRELVALQILEDDGVCFQPESITTSPITKGAGYEGVRVEFLAHLGKIAIKLKVDIGFGDVLYPQPEMLKLTTFLQEMPSPEIICYPKETLIAEKFQAMTALGRLNTRMKDFYDIRFLSQQFEFNAATLSEAISGTFSNRNTKPTDALSLFTSGFASYKQTHWETFVRRTKMADLPENFSEIINDLEVFLLPIMNKSVQEGTWAPLHGWQSA